MKIAFYQTSQGRGKLSDNYHYSIK
jgi:hypothetical protein